MSDPTQDDVDSYARWLRYVEAGGRDIGRAQIRPGAAAARDSSDPVSRHAAYLQVEDQARERGAGMWHGMSLTNTPGLMTAKGLQAV